MIKNFIPRLERVPAKMRSFVSKTGAAALRGMQRTDDTAARYARHSVNKISGFAYPQWPAQTMFQVRIRIVAV